MQNLSNVDFSTKVAGLNHVHIQINNKYKLTLKQKKKNQEKSNSSTKALKWDKKPLVINSTAIKILEILNTFCDGDNKMPDI